MSISFNPIGPWPVVAVAALAVVGLTIWAYRERLRGSTGSWRYLALGLRLAAVLLCLLATLRPSINLPEKKSQTAVVVFLLDRSSSLQIGDELDGQTRWQVARKAIEAGRKAVEAKSKDFEVKEYLFDVDLREEKTDDTTKPEGRETAVGSALLESIKRQVGANVAAIVLVSDGSNNAGVPPLAAAAQLKGKLIPVYAIGVGDENAGAGSKDVAIKSFEIGPTVFVKNQPEIRGAISARGFAGKALDVELQVENEGVVARTTVRPTSGSEVIPITGLKYLPQTPNEKRVTLVVKPQDGELVTSNNSFTTYLSVLSGGLKVLFVKGPNHSWEPRFLTRGLAGAKEIHIDFTEIRQPAVGDSGLLKDAEFAPGAYDVYILSDLAADFLTTRQQQALAQAVARGAGLIMLGGRSSFGEGGWGNTAVAGVLPVTLHPGDGELTPPDGLKFEPDTLGLQSFILRLAPTPEASRRIWESLPPMTGANRFGPVKGSAMILGHTAAPNREPAMVAMESGRGRTIAFGGETWTWFRGPDEGRMAHLRFWRQAILWLAHKEDTGDNEVKLRLDSRRVAVGQRLEVAARATDPKKEPIPDAVFATTMTRVDATDGDKPIPIELFAQGEEAKGYTFVKGVPGEYKVEVVGTKGGREIGRDSARFNVYQDDRELENPAADRELLRQIAALTGGKSVAPEEIGKELASLDMTATERVSLTEKRVWDNWYFFLIFTALLSVEWWLRKRKGWV